MVFIEQEKTQGTAGQARFSGAVPTPTYRVPPRTPPLDPQRLASANNRESSVVYGNQSIVIDSLPGEKKEKVLVFDSRFSVK